MDQDEMPETIETVAEYDAAMDRLRQLLSKGRGRTPEDAAIMSRLGQLILDYEERMTSSDDGLDFAG
jgi:hypothetical protein